MSFKSEGNFELRFIDQTKFEIDCANKGQELFILGELRKSNFVKDICAVEMRGVYPYQITGKTISQEWLTSLLKEWDEDLNNVEVSEYKDLN
ncbi:hypothetical protein ACFODO_20835 [Acinetobacter sichuanensis]|uniref:Uncharacterized protein n=1 Tax=Acinetobacter sichuanensis TaxID=2136183 RepID=A0A371YJ70_9GAMM|nr:hypothetical protein [Acinetobacter sichuanensis]RFC81539.1 hypothetical protein C9E89_021325 [Acinetobacter sichuanensis]